VEAGKRYEVQAANFGKRFSVNIMFRPVVQAANITAVLKRKGLRKAPSFSQGFGEDQEPTHCPLTPRAPRKRWESDCSTHTTRVKR